MFTSQLKCQDNLKRELSPPLNPLSSLGPIYPIQVFIIKIIIISLAADLITVYSAL